MNEETAIFLKKAEEYISLAVEKEREKKYEMAKKYYTMAAKYILEAAKKSPAELKKSRIKKAEKLMERAKLLPSPIVEEDKDVIQLLEKPEIGFKNVAGLNEIKEKIKDLIITPFLYPEIAKKWKVRTGGGILLYGPPGTGKTLLAKAVAGELDADFFYMKASDIMSKWVGESEKRIATLFEKARESRRAVIFIDEIDALLPKRTGQTSTVMRRVVPQFLAELDGLDTKNDKILFMAATNVPWEIDPAVLRPGRFDFKFYVPLPDFEARKKIFELNLDVPKEEDFDFNLLADMAKGYSGADIKFVCEEVKRLMFKREIEGRKSILGTDDVITILQSINPSIDEKLLEKYEKFGKKFMEV